MLLGICEFRENRSRKDRPFLKGINKSTHTPTPENRMTFRG
jgi:hypothetical protein